MKTLFLFSLQIILCSQTQNVHFITVNDLIKKPEILYIKFNDAIHLHFNKFPIPSSETSTWNNPVIAESFVLTIPHCHVFCDTGITFLEQVELFHNAEIIVAAHGAGLTNILFSEPGTKVYEIFQEHEDDAFWYLSQLLNLNHTCIKTTEFKKGGGYQDTLISAETLESIYKL